jgi:hypothetical protein
MRRVKQPEDLLLLTAFVILLTCGLAQSFRLSALLANMAGAAVIVNRALFIKRRIQKVFADFGIVLYALFFITGGAHLDLSSIPAIGVLGLIYFVGAPGGQSGRGAAGSVLGQQGPVRKHRFQPDSPSGGGGGPGAGGGPRVRARATMARRHRLGQSGGEHPLFTTILTEVLGPYLDAAGADSGGRSPDSRTGKSVERDKR